MLEYFTYKKIKKHQAEKHAKEGATTPVLSAEDEAFLERIISEEGPPPPLPARPISINLEASDIADDSSQVSTRDTTEKDDAHKDKGKGKRKERDDDADKPTKKANRFSIFRKNKSDSLQPHPPVTVTEAEKEEDDITRVLDELNLAAVNNRAFSISKESQELVKKFTVILKDLMNGVPTAYDDLVKLLEGSNDQLTKTYEHLPTFLKKLIATLPNKLTGSVAPELLAVAAEAQAFTGAEAVATSGGLAGAAKSLLTFTSLKNLVTKPGAVAGMLRAIINALKLRWPAFLGTNVLLSLGLFVLLFVFWYCHKRGREVRLEREKSEAGASGTSDGAARIVELQDDPALTAPEAGVNRVPTPSITVEPDTIPAPEDSGRSSSAKPSGPKQH